MNNDIERWSQAFLDPGWSHLVIRQTEVKTLDDFYTVMMRSRDVRRQIVERVLKGKLVELFYIRRACDISFPAVYSKATGLSGIYFRFLKRPLSDTNRLLKHLNNYLCDNANIPNSL